MLPLPTETCGLGEGCTPSAEELGATSQKGLLHGEPMGVGWITPDQHAQSCSVNTAARAQLLGSSEAIKPPPSFLPGQWVSVQTLPTSQPHEALLSTHPHIRTAGVERDLVKANALLEVSCLLGDEHAH